MAILLSFPASAPRAKRSAPDANATADILILPCIRRERMDADTAAFRSDAAEMQAQRQA